MENIYQIFISATKKHMEIERNNLINSLLLQNCYPVTMEYFVTSHGVSTLNACLNAIDRSDAVILLLKDNYGEKIEKTIIESSFPEGCPFKAKGLCNCVNDTHCKYSFTHFEYKYSVMLNKIIYVLFHESLFDGNEKSIELDGFKNDTNLNGGYNVYSDKDFNSISSAIISKIKNDCSKKNNLGLIKADIRSKLGVLENRLSLFENAIFDGFIPIKNYMGCIIKNNDLIFYVYKESRMLREKHGFDFSIHINTDQDEHFSGKLSRQFINAHAYVRYSRKNGFSDFIECNIQEKSYGKEYLNCHIEFSNISGARLPVGKNKTIGVLYTYHVDKKLYGNEIGRKISPFLEKTVVELRYPSAQPQQYECFEKKENALIMLEDIDAYSIEQTDVSFLETILTSSEIDKYILEIYDQNLMYNDLKTISVDVPTRDVYGNDHPMHFYIRWEKI